LLGAANATLALRRREGAAFHGRDLEGQLSDDLAHLVAIGRVTANGAQRSLFAARVRVNRGPRAPRRERGVLGRGGSERRAPAVWLDALIETDQRQARARGGRQRRGSGRAL
jgi:hypothetical protein